MLSEPSFSKVLLLQTVGSGRINEHQPTMHYVKKAQIAAHFGISSRKVNNLMKEGLPYIKIGRSVRFSIEDCNDWMLKINGR